ncbi:MAG: hypothetical protein QOE13_1401 [Gaiellaceae bacterium]|nr:hypothetical protein [Gaiellaceae bacterium]
MSTIVTRNEAADTGLLASAGLPRVELAVREQAGVVVTLLWLRGTDVLFVSLTDHGNGEAFELVLQPHERALDVFYHPYAYAAGRGLDTGRRTWEREDELVDA